MPPNRQSVASVLRSLSANDLAGFVTESKYAPLTASVDDEVASAVPAAPPAKAAAVEIEVEQEQEQAEAEDYWYEAQPDQEEEEVNAESYWGWPSLVEQQDSVLDAAEAEDLAQQEQEEWEAEVARREAVVAQILAEEKARSLVSTDSIVKNLVADAVKARDAEPVEIVRNDQMEEEDYWDWDDETDTPQDEPDASAFAAAHVVDLIKKEAVRIKVHSLSPQVQGGGARENYWDWETLTPDQEKARVIANILQDEKARLLLTSSHVAENLKADANRSETAVVRNEEKSSEDYWDWDGPKADQVTEPKVRAPHTQDPGHPNNSYWDWTPPVTEEESRDAIVQSILADEAARKLLSSSLSEDALKKSSRPSSSEVVRNEEEKSEGNYWDWNPSSGDDRQAPNKVHAPHTCDPTHPSNSYWDWTPAVTEEESRNQMIQRILADEAARRMVSAERTEEVLKAGAWSDAKARADRGYYREEETVVRNDETSEEAGYWDM
mmetsp:Transcript_8852/g.16300  ORF Transcript_8852/g.16300 Transcript_8852/m.16300 type:complete len:494 (-) Transcript_8852:131-1612(-)